MKMRNIDRHWRDESRKLGSSSPLHICDFPHLHWVLSWLFSPGIAQKLTEYRLEFTFQFILEEAISTFQTFILTFEPVNLTPQIHWRLWETTSCWWGKLSTTQIWCLRWRTYLCLLCLSLICRYHSKFINTSNKELPTKVTTGIFSVLTIG